MKIVSIVGARPQFVKVAALDWVIPDYPGLEHFVIHTGQHYDEKLSARFFDELDIRPPDYNLEVGSGSHGLQTGRMLIEIEKVLLGLKPDWVVVYGDTNSTLAGTIAATKLHIPVAHVEAGLRSYNRRMPEELNRIGTDHLSDLLLTPTETATARLRYEGISAEKVVNVGDVMLDVALHITASAKSRPSILDELGLNTKDYILSTIHRAENTDDITRLGGMLSALDKIAETMPVILPLHPRTSLAIRNLGLAEKFGGITIIDPVSYHEMVMLESHARLVATDSGGVQKESYFFEVPCVTLRDETEWVELVECGCNKLVGADHNSIVATIKESLNEALPDFSGQLFGDGKAAKRIVEAIQAFGNDEN